MKRRILFLMCMLFFVNCLCFSGPAKDKWSAKLDEIRHFRNVEMKQYMDLMESWYHNLSTEEYNRKMDSRETRDKIQRMKNKGERLQRELMKLEIAMNEEKKKEVQQNIDRLKKELLRDLAKNMNKGNAEARKTEVMISLGMGMGSYSHHMQHVTDKDYLEFHSAKLSEFISACFIGDEKIQTDSGEVAIKDIKNGDYVQSCNIEQGECVFKRVKEVGERLAPMSDLVELTLSNGKKTTVTKNHMIYAKGLGYVDAEYLKTLDRLITNGEELSVVNVKKLSGETLVYVYNLEVEENEYDNQNYFINSFLAHNCSAVMDCYGILGVGRSLAGIKAAYDASNSCKEAYEKLSNFFDA